VELDDFDVADLVLEVAGRCELGIGRADEGNRLREPEQCEGAGGADDDVAP